MAAAYGAKSAIAEQRYLGGTCVNVGCIPKKLFVYASHFAEEFENARGFGWRNADPVFDWSELLSNKNREISRLNRVYEKLLSDAGARLFEGRAVLAGPHTISINGADYTAEHILIATGSWPVKPDIPGREHTITSNEAFYLEKLPAKIIIIGGGYIAVEFAGIFNGLGVDTTLVYRGPLLLRGFDKEIREFLSGEIQKKGITLVTNTVIERIGRNNGRLRVRLSNGREPETDTVMLATGRRPNTQGLGLPEAGVKCDENGAVVINERYQSSVESVYAIGDVTNRYNLTPVATAEGTLLAGSLFGGKAARVDYGNIPTCVFSQPSLGTVGLTEEQARKKFADISVYKSGFTALKHTLTGSEEKTFLKMIVNNGDNRVIGAHMVGAEAGEIIQGIAIAMKAGATKADFDATIGIHPTTAEEFVTMREPAKSVS